MVPQPTVLHYKITTPKSKVFKFESVSKTAEVKHEMQDTKNTILYIKKYLKLPFISTGLIHLPKGF